MKTWVVTGGAASGKSAFTKALLSEYPESELFSSDACVHELLTADDKVIKAIQLTFGDSVIDKTTGTVVRAVLRDLVFDDEKARKKLEGILHPRVRKAFKEWKSQHEAEGAAQLLIAEVPLFYETAQEYPADAVILVAISAELQRQRIVETRNLSPEDADRILQAQLPLSRKLELASTVVWNEGDLSLLHLQIKILLQQLIFNDAS